MASQNDPADGRHSDAAQAADATDEVQRNTKTQTEAASYTTRDHDVIRAWAEARGGVPAGVSGTGAGDDPGILRIDFPERGDDSSFEEVDWEPFFAKFDDSDLDFVYQEHTSDGSVSRFNRFTRSSK